jgi:hypothetical protein
MVEVVVSWNRVAERFSRKTFFDRLHDRRRARLMENLRAAKILTSARREIAKRVE